MSPPDWNRLLLAYADGELGPAERAHVERYLAEHPQAYDLLAGLEETGPGNFELWDAVEPPEPSEADWLRTTQAIAVLPRSRWRRTHVLAGWLAACVLAAFVIGRMMPDAPAVAERNAPQNTPAPFDPLAEYAVLPVATPDDAMVNAVRGPRDTGFVAVRPPLAEPLALATSDDADVENAGNARVTEGDGAMMLSPKK